MCVSLLLSPMPQHTPQRCSDSVFSAFSGTSLGVTIGVYYSNAHFKSCTFRGLSENIPPESPGVWESVYGAIHVSGLNASLILDNCTFSDILSPHSIGGNRGAYVFSDNSQNTVRCSKTRDLPCHVCFVCNRMWRGATSLNDVCCWAHSPGDMAEHAHVFLTGCGSPSAFFCAF